MHKNNSWTMNVITLEYSYVFNFEKNYSYVDTQKWLLDNLVYCYGCMMLYFIIIVSGMVYMLNRPKYNLRRPFALWCGLNALFSIIGFCRTVPELIFALRYRSIYYSICIASNYFQNPVFGFWTWALVLSKVVQLINIMFIVLSKQRLTFHQIYHQVSVIPYFFFAYIEGIAVMRWLTVIDYILHSCLYSYYALKSLQFKLPNFVPPMIIVMQMIQSAINCIIIIMAYNQQYAYNLECKISLETAVAGVLYYFVSFFSFVDVYFSTYISR